MASRTNLPRRPHRVPRPVGRAGAVLALGLGCFAPALLASPAARAADPTHPTVVELFESEGCSSCPPAAAAVMAVAHDDPSILALQWEVTYWDDLGWRDRFDDPAYTARQRDYADRFGRDEVFTPEVVVNGRADDIGTPRAALEALIARENRGDAGPSITAQDGRIVVAEAAGGPDARVLLVRYDPNIVRVPIGRGENAGRTLPHQDLVRGLATLGQTAPGGTVTFVRPAPVAGLDEAVLVQAGAGGPILAASRLPRGEAPPPA